MTEIDCEQVLEQIWSYLDGEMDERAYLEIRLHVSECSGCGPKYEFQHKLLALIEAKCREGPMPAGLRERLFRLLEDHR